MVFSFDILIKENEISKVKISELLFEWGGELHSQEPPQYAYNSSLIFERILDMDYYKKYHSDLIGSDLDVDAYLPLRLLGNHMSKLEKIVNMNRQELSNSDVIKFLHDISKVDTFAIFMEREEEWFDRRYRINTSEELIDIVCNSLNWESPEGVLITKL